MRIGFDVRPFLRQETGVGVYFKNLLFELAALDRYARRIGLAFQVIDDVLDCEADSATLGKTAGKDAAHDKPTYVSLMGLGEARSYAHALLADAHEALALFGARARRLQQLADYIVARSF